MRYIGEKCFFINEEPNQSMNNGFGAPLWLGEILDIDKVRSTHTPRVPE